MLKALRFCSLILLISFTQTLKTYASSSLEWPLALEGKTITVPIYQPQPKALTGIQLFSRAPISIAKKGLNGLIFGALINRTNTDVIKFPQKIIGRRYI